MRLPKGKRSREHLKLGLVTLVLLGFLVYFIEAERFWPVALIACLLLFLHYITFHNYIDVVDERNNLRWTMYLSHGASSEELEGIADKSDNA